MITTGGTKTDSLTTSYDLSQVLSYSNYILANSSLCIDFIFTNYCNLIIESEVHPSVHPNHNRQIVFVKLNLKSEHPPLYDHSKLDYKNANVQPINRSIKTFDLEESCKGKNFHDQVYLLNKKTLIIFYNFIPKNLFLIILC